MPKSTESPMMKQYLRFKAEHPDAILFFHLGDFYEAFFDDAEILARELDIVLTSRNGHPMAGVPIRRGEAYVNQLLRRGYKVAVCRQMEDPKTAKGLVRRDVVRVVTPGTALDDAVLDAGVNNYLAALRPAGHEGFGIAFLDLSTGEFSCTIADGAPSLRGEMERRDPSEVLVSETDDPTPLAALLEGRLVTRVPEATFSVRIARAEDQGVDERALQAAAAVTAYVEQTQQASPSHLRPVHPYRIADHMDLDPFTISSLELVRPAREGQEKGTLLHALDRTVTGMGRRRLRRLILAPLTNRATIEERLDAVQALTSGALVRDELREAVVRIHDLERLIGKLGSGRLRPQDLLLLLRSLEAIPRIGQTLAEESLRNSASALLASIRGKLGSPELEMLRARFASMLVDQPPVDVRDGGFIRPGYSSDLDLLREESRAMRERLAHLEGTERERTGIPSLKVGYNRVFGYYLEVTRPHLDKVPPEYVRRQTLANAERFITDELRGIEGRIANSEERAQALEAELYDQAVGVLRGAIPQLQESADALAELDVLLSLADVAHRYRYVRPTFHARHAVEIRGGRHPVVERIEEFVPNDLDLPEGRDLVILTGPNMAGKSVFLRQAALVSLMAQMGSFVPAKSAALPIVDRVFARVGASDMLSSGISTFMMEMLEVAAILERATSRSLIILDEMGRGTSTFDGVSIAWAVAEELAHRVRAKTLFATHYQELTRLEEEIPNVVNLHVLVKEVGKNVVFLHRVEPGTAEGSYGVHVARLAGLPTHVTDAADRILADLLSEAPLTRLARKGPTAEPLRLFGAEDDPILRALRKLDPDRMTPLEALERLADLKRQAGERHADERGAE
ncbi:MAG: DNA mismatch repair protein MutS [Candidatus Bipolaricaulis sp.]|nr:DNA mismatch repair protein MutS [Candidatus Bipolaricaulis sp.]